MGTGADDAGAADEGEGTGAAVGVPVGAGAVGAVVVGIGADDTGEVGALVVAKGDGVGIPGVAKEQEDASYGTQFTVVNCPFVKSA